ncbi:L-seryl-tRNA(Sec) kinase isoform X2 [Sarcophilus harrisii]|uniref:Phosphoseryl-tRNA kinase n=1 Tax=Sarcophilus harrisii TaxID=9305 RepID=A0A7N4NPR0_SARHA|nr:L-seryl-tRNA(Sec) kinase isoform X2 [Sarcophilus harrisii]
MTSFLVIGGRPSPSNSTQRNARPSALRMCTRGRLGSPLARVLSLGLASMKRGEPPGDAGSERQIRLGCCVLCGLPASGKSTLSRFLSEQLRRKQGWDVAVVTYDDVIPEALLAGENAQPSQWKSFRHELLTYLEHFLMAIVNGCKLSAPALRTEVMWESFVHCLKNQSLIIASGTGKTQGYSLTHAAPSQPFYLILDDNFYYQSMRYEVYQLARKYSSGFCQLFLDCPIESCLERNRQRSKPVPDDTIQLMARKIESPNIQKNAWEHNSLTVRSTGPCSDDNVEVIDLLITALKNPIRYFEENVEQKETDRIICSTNTLHQADQQFRRIISQTMKKAKDEKVIAYKLKLLAEELNKLKADFLEDLRQGNSKRISCFHQNSISDVIRLFHYERDNIVQKYIPNEY